ncbi:hypothetical protein M878_06800 [Streptomyces roseochromogenus subsp. oscitans DS 12.976]|uniref:Uncharacterized protein n=1 Tax=Streptomyces roseochromogenus subsp. oscitans DS 12.976 TaxID=1352936 RepID=V6L213_STRRC|nr:hypothetical protein M878_06800 [Streptomyces roseochromogenus subsp. oscitans DS 12.976]
MAHQPPRRGSSTGVATLGICICIGQGLALVLVLVLVLES